MTTPTLLRLHSVAIRGDNLDATESEHAEGWRAMLAANAILRDGMQRSSPSNAELCGYGMQYADRRLRGEWVAP